MSRCLAGGLVAGIRSWVVGHTRRTRFCLIRESKAFISQHIGDLENLETLEHFQSPLNTFRKLFRIDPHVVAHDMHPDYLSTRFAREYPESGALRIAVQHHHAHIASV